MGASIDPCQLANHNHNLDTIDTILPPLALRTTSYDLKTEMSYQNWSILWYMNKSYRLRSYWDWESEANTVIYTLRATKAGKSWHEMI